MEALFIKTYLMTISVVDTPCCQTIPSKYHQNIESLFHTP